MSALVAEGLGKRYGDKWGLVEATFDVGEEELAVLAGPNGAGKTTTVRVLATVLRPSRGRAYVLGLDTVRDYKRVREKISYMPQGYRPSRNLTPFEAVRWSLVARGWPIREARAQARKWLEELGLWEDRNKTCWVLSGGQRVKVAVAMALAPEAPVTFLDEPTVGLDVNAKHAVWRAVRGFVSSGATVLLTTHDMREAEVLADKVVFLNKGRVIVVGEPKRLVGLLPYRYRVVAKKVREVEGLGRGIVDLGDRVVVYAGSRREAARIVEELGAGVLSVDQVGLEDVFVHLAGVARHEGG